MSFHSNVQLVNNTDLHLDVGQLSASAGYPPAVAPAGAFSTAAAAGAGGLAAGATDIEEPAPSATSAAEAAAAAAAAVAPAVLESLAPGQAFWLPLALIAPGAASLALRCALPPGSLQPSGWSAALAPEDLLPAFAGAAPAGRRIVSLPLSSAAAAGTSDALSPRSPAHSPHAAAAAAAGPLLLVSLQPSYDEASGHWRVALHAPLEVCNSLPVPATAEFASVGAGALPLAAQPPPLQSVNQGPGYQPPSGPGRHHLAPGQAVRLYGSDVCHASHVRFQPAGSSFSGWVAIRGGNAPCVSRSASRAGSSGGLSDAASSDAVGRWGAPPSPTAAQAYASAPFSGGQPPFLRQGATAGSSLDLGPQTLTHPLYVRATGAAAGGGMQALRLTVASGGAVGRPSGGGAPPLRLRLSCTLWVYNLLPYELRLREAPGAAADDGSGAPLLPAGDAICVPSYLQAAAAAAAATAPSHVQPDVGPASASGTALYSALSPISGARSALSRQLQATPPKPAATDGEALAATAAANAARRPIASPSGPIRVSASAPQLQAAEAGVDSGIVATAVAGGAGGTPAVRTTATASAAPPAAVPFLLGTLGGLPGPTRADFTLQLSLAPVPAPRAGGRATVGAGGGPAARGPLRTPQERPGSWSEAVSLAVRGRSAGEAVTTSIELPVPDGAVPGTTAGGATVTVLLTLRHADDGCVHWATVLNWLVKHCAALPWLLYQLPAVSQSFNERPSLHIELTNSERPALPGLQYCDGVVLKARACRPSRTPTNMASVPCCREAWSLEAAPAFTLRSALPHDVDYRQAGTRGATTLAAGASAPVRWTDVSLPRRLAFRAADGPWSAPAGGGGAAAAAGWLGIPAGGALLKLRDRHHTQTQLVVLSPAVSPSGITLLTLLPYQPLAPPPALAAAAGGSGRGSSAAADGGAAAAPPPYRIDNCTKHMLKVWQDSHPGDTDTVPAFGSAPYIWDDPAAPHTLVLAVANQKLCKLPLDEAPRERVVPLPAASASGGAGSGAPGNGNGGGGKQLRVSTRLEGALKVLRVEDASRHPGGASDAGAAGGSAARLQAAAMRLSFLHRLKAGSRGDAAASATREAGGSPSWPTASRGVLPYSPLPHCRHLPPQLQRAAPPPIALRLDLAGFGLSLASGAPSECLYACVRGVVASVRLDPSARSLGGHLRVAAIAVDDPHPEAQYTAVLESPVSHSLFSLMQNVGGSAGADSDRSAARRLALSVGGHVRLDAAGRCAEARDVSLRLAPMAINVDGQRVEALRALIVALAAAAVAPLPPRFGPFGPAPLPLTAPPAPAGNADAGNCGGAFVTAQHGDEGPALLRMASTSFDPEPGTAGQSGLKPLRNSIAGAARSGAPPSSAVVATVAAAAASPVDDVALLLGRVPAAPLAPFRVTLEGSGLELSSIEVCVSVDPHESW